MTPELFRRLTQLRHDLHRIPEVSGQEARTAAFIEDTLTRHTPDSLISGLGGYGVAAVFDSGTPGPTVMIRCELDGLPIPEQSEARYRSTHEGRGHLCGHDGHMAIVAGLADWLAARPLARGRVVLLFQPAEETGKGAAAVLADPRFASIAPDYAFSLHNLPGLALGQVAICAGPANCASRGMRIRLTGRTSHAAAPQDGISPAGTLVRLLPDLAALGQGGDRGGDYALVTLTHARMGEATFGIAPGEAEIWATLRTVTNDRMEQLIAEAQSVAGSVAAEQGLHIDIDYDDVFDACTNHPTAVALLDRACKTAGTPAEIHHTPQRWSEDFGQFGASARAAMFWLGSGKDQPQLHNPDYDFPDAALPIGVAVFRAAIAAVLIETSAGNR
ncbi:amidohydrolase [Rhodobacteraceae bacterium M382]|nr:amidohydrolase [Rhodobacteraceae bacterium M382]